MPITGPDTSLIACDCRIDRRHPFLDVTLDRSTTTIASSTTRPMASTNANSDNVLIEKPRNGNAANVPMSDTGTAMIGMSVARQFCRKRNTTMMTRIRADDERLHDLADALVTGSVVSSEIW
jgi:hypothetical protein